MASNTWLLRKSYESWIRGVLDDNQLQPAGGTWAERGCFLLARAVRDCLREKNVDATLADYTQPGDPVPKHVVVVVGSLRLDRDGVWTDEDCPSSLQGCTRTFLDARKEKERWDWSFDDKRLRSKVMDRLRETFPAAADQDSNGAVQ